MNKRFNYNKLLKCLLSFGRNLKGISKCKPNLSKSF